LFSVSNSLDSVFIGDIAEAVNLNSINKEFTRNVSVLCIVYFTKISLETKSKWML